MLSSGKVVALSLILFFGCLGGYNSLYIAYRDGFFEALKICIANPDSSLCKLERPTGFNCPAYTGIERLDATVAVLLEFFASGLQSDHGSMDLEAILGTSYMAAQFGGAWFLMQLEGFRVENTRTIFSWTGTFGIIFQIATITVISPIYLALQLLSSPSSDNGASVAADLLDLDLLPWSTTFCYILPSIAMTLPLFNLLSTEGNYMVIALWQPFPLYQSILHQVYRFITGKSKQSTRKGWLSRSWDYDNSLNLAYSFLIGLSMIAHLAVLGLIVLSPFVESIPQLSPEGILVPYSSTSPPTLALTQKYVPMQVSKAIVKGFLQWDVYCTCGAFNVWAAYRAYNAPDGPGILGILGRVLFLGTVAGPIAPAAFMLWERDLAVLEWSREEEKTKKTH